MQYKLATAFVTSSFVDFTRLDCYMSVKPPSLNYDNFYGNSYNIVGRQFFNTNAFTTTEMADAPNGRNKQSRFLRVY